MATKFVSITRLTTFLSSLKTWLSNNYVPKSRTVNNKALSSNISLTASDISALPINGGTLTGDLTVGSSSIKTNGYIKGTWLQTTAITNKNANTGKVAVIDSEGWLYYRTPAEIVKEAGGSGATTVTYTATTSTSWTSTSDYYTQTITVSGLLATDNPIVSIIPTITNHENEWSAWNSVFKITTAANKLTLYSDEAIDIALSLQIKVVR